MKLKIYAGIVTLIIIGLFTMAAYRPGKYHGEMFMYESDGVITVTDANAYILISDEDWESGHTHEMSFTEGRTVDANITSEANNTVLRIVTSGAHNLTTGDEVSIQNAENAGHNGVTTVTVIDGTTFDCDDINYVDDAGVSDAVVVEGAYLQLGPGGAGEFLFMWSFSGNSGANAQNWKAEIFINSTALDASSAEMTPAGQAHQTMSGMALHDLAVGDRVYLAIMNETGSNDMNLEHATVLLIPL